MKTRPHILITSQVFPPEIHPSAVMVRELAEHLSATGWRVTVATGFPHHPHGRVYPGYRAGPWLHERWAGIDVLRLWHLISPSRRIAVRAATFVSQAAASAIGGALTHDVDLVLVYGPPLVGPALGWAVAKRHHAPLVNVVYDIYPDIAVETGHVTNPAVIAAARLAERFQYWGARRTVVLSDGFKRTLMLKGVPEDKIAVIPVWLDPDEIKPLDRDNAWRREQKIPLDRTVVLYAGTIGVVSGAAMVADAAAILRDRPDLLFLFVGEGAARHEVESRARSLGLDNMRFLPFQPRERLPEVQATGDIGLVTLAPGRGRTSVPSKVLGYMAAGRSVVASVDEDSDTAREIGDNNLGCVCRPADATALARAVTQLAQDKDLRKTCGENGRRRLETHYAKPAVLTHYLRVLEGALNS